LRLAFLKSPGGPGFSLLYDVRDALADIPLPKTGVPLSFASAIVQL